MDARKLGNSIRNFAILVALGCLAWWAIFYSAVIRQAGSQQDSLTSFFGCILIDDQKCTIIKTVAKLAGYTPYEPFVLWGAGALLVLGIIIGNSAK